MSLGWQTESALLPSKAKPIHVDSKSLIQLKSLVSQQEKLRQEDREDEDNIATKRRRIIRNHKSKQISRDNHFSPSSSNAPTESSEISVELRVKRSLEAKAKLYEEMLSQGLHSKTTTDTAVGLVDFDEKRRSMAQIAPQKEFDEEEEEKENEVVPAPRSEEEIPVTSEYGPQQWQWSTVNPSQSVEQEDFSSEWRAEKEFKGLVESRINEELTLHRQNEAMNQRNVTSVSEAARIKTQWEKTLQSTAKVFLEEVHQKTEEERANSSHSSSSLQKRSLREEKLEMIERKRMEMQKK